MDAINRAARLLGRKGGRITADRMTPDGRIERAAKAGRAAQAKLTPEQRTERARKAVRARWARREPPPVAKP
jgi:hypothetical protein